jgi:amino acid adenylation domain-containing protein
MSNISERVRRAASVRPQAIALSSGEAQLTYGELDRNASRLAGYLVQQGVGQGSVVPLLMERSFEQIVAALSVMRAGAAYLPMDPTWPKERIRAILRDSGAEVLLAPGDVAARLETGLRNVCVAHDADAIAKATPYLEADLSEESLAYVIYTSGSTGTPKGVEITRGNLNNLVDWHLEAFAVTEDDRASHIAGLGFDAAVWEVWPYLAAGATVQLPGPMDELIRSSPAHLLRWLHDGHITHCFVPTALAEPLIQTGWPETTLLRYLLTGGDALRRNPLPGLPFAVVNNYGPTECTVVATFGLIDADGPSPPPIGRAIRGATTHVLDENRLPVASGAIGELYVGGAGVARGYRNLPQQTAASFLDDPFSAQPGARMYRTGDMVAELADGRLAFHGRRDSQDKIRGQRVELDEINAVLSRCAGVLFSCVGTCLDAAGDKYLVAYVLPDESAVPSSRELQEYLSQYLPAAMIPAAFVHLKTMPLNASGKLELAQLPEPCAENELGGGHAAVPREATELEAAVLAIVHGLLGSGAVELDDDFFLSGGHSLLGAQLVTRIRSNYGIALTLRDLFEAPTAALLAAKVEDLILAQISEMSEAEAEASL